MIRKTSETRPLTGSVVNEYNTSDKNAYSSKYINDIMTYSTDEYFTGKHWKNGKKIYGRVYTGTVTAGTSVTIDTISNLDDIVMVNGTFNNGANEFQLDYYHSSSEKGNWWRALTSGGVPINTIRYNNAQAGTYKMTIEYTKTTD